MSDALLVHAWKCIDWGLLDGAQFAAERLLAAAPSGDAQFVYAQSLWLSGRVWSASAATQDVLHPGCAYIYAQCSLKQGQPRKGVDALERTRKYWDQPPMSQEHATNSPGGNATGTSNGVGVGIGASGTADVYSHSTATASGTSLPPSMLSTAPASSVNDAANAEQEFASLCASKIPPRPVFTLLLGRLYLAMDDLEAGVTALVQSAKENPYLWENCRLLCEQRRIDVSSTALFPDASLTPPKESNSTDLSAENTSDTNESSSNNRPLSNSSRAEHTASQHLGGDFGNFSSLDLPTPLPGNTTSAINIGFDPSRFGPLDPFLTPTMPPPQQPSNGQPLIQTRLGPQQPLFSDISSSFEGRDPFDISAVGFSTTPARIRQFSGSGPLAAPRRRPAAPLFDEDLLAQLHPPEFSPRPAAAGSIISPGSSSTSFVSGPASFIPSLGRACAASLRTSDSARSLTAVAESSADFPATPLPQRVQTTGKTTSFAPPKLESTPAVQPGISHSAIPALSPIAGAPPQSQMASSRVLATLYEPFAAALQLLSRYQCVEALAALDRVPKAQKRTPLYHSLQAQSYFRQLKYKRAAESFSALRIADPYRVEGMETYSKVLWQLRQELELAALAHELSAVARDAWQTWCVFGDLHSLVHDSTQALQCYRRATQLVHSGCGAASASSLLGHELADSDELQAARDAFRTALGHDRDNLNAWFGLGMVLFRLGDFDGADAHIAHALLLHPSNAVLHTFAGTVCEQRGRDAQAFAHFRRATEVDPENMTARFKLAEALIAAGMPSDALRELAVFESKPPNANVQLALGRAYRVLGERARALKYLTLALTLDPQVASAARAELALLEADA